LISFFIIASNFRALAKGLYVWTAVTDGLCVLQGMVMAKLMIEDAKMRDGWSISGFTLGGYVRLRTFYSRNQDTLGKLSIILYEPHRPTSV